MDFDLTDEQRLIKQTAREFTDNEIVVQSRENARNHHFDLEMVKKIADQGYLGAIVPHGVRRRGPRLPQLRARRRGDRPRRLLGPHGRSRCRPRWCARRSSSGAPRSRSSKYLPKLCSGEWLGCFGLTEPDTGSDAANQKTRAKKTDSGWVINGAKMWISMGNYAKVALIFAQTDPELGHKGLGVLPRRHRPARLQTADDRAQDGPARLRHRLDRARRRRGLRRRTCSATIGDGFKVAMSIARLRPLLGGRRLRGHLPGLRRGVGQIRQGARAVRQADRELPARAGDDRRHGAQDRRLAHARVARGLAEGQGPPEHARDLDRQAPRHRGLAGVREHSRSRSTAARATSTTTPSSATSATCA